MVIQNAFKEKHRMLKGNLHMHTTRSDGKLTPEEAMRYYKQHGYDFIAITDHRVYNSKNFLPEIGLTVIPGMEYDNGLNIPCDHGFRCFHTVCIGSDDAAKNGFEHDFHPGSAVAKDQAEYQPYLDKIHANGNLTIYCHPEWSSTPARYFDKMRGNVAMEIWNSGSAIDCDMDMDAPYWDELLGMGIQLFGVATDDSHSTNDACFGWIMVNAENNVDSILEAIERGAFYSSCGPEIYDFRVEDGLIKIKCSPVKKIRLHSDGHYTMMKVADDEELTYAEFPLKCADWIGKYAYVRISVIDKDGKYAWTNPIFFYSEN